MSAAVFAIVLCAALFHAAWNALVKVNADRFIAIVMVAAASGMITAPLLPFLPAPDPAAWPFFALSMVLHTGYMLFLVRAYDHGDLGQVYPLARGAAPLLVAAMSPLAGEILSTGTLVAIALLTAGIASLAFRGGRLPFRHDPAPVLYALGTAVFIAGYTVTDGLGARAAGTAHGYTAWLFFINAMPLLALLLWRRGTNALTAARHHWKTSLAAGALSLAAYWLVIWAMTHAPLAMVAALRETSVLFAALIATFMLKEPFGRWRTLATILVTTGIVLLRL